MKRILTLLIAMGAFATLHAQSREETRRIILGERRDDGTYSGRNDRDVVYGRGDRQYEIDRINREYDNKIYSIRNNPNLSAEEKARMIRDLERDRQRRIADINGNNRRYDNDDRYDRNERYARNGNGNKRGWEIGRGNPHRNGGKDKGWKKNGRKNKNWN